MNFGTLIRDFAVGHGLFNMLIFVALLYHTWLGFKIRRNRKSRQPQFQVIKRHRTLGPMLTFLSLTGYIWGIVLVLADEGELLRYPIHLYFGSLLVFLFFVQYAVSTRIKGQDSHWRTPHLWIGMALLFVYVVQMGLGLLIL